MILPDSRNFGQSYSLYVLANTDEPLTASEISSLNKNSRKSNIHQACKDLFDQGYLVRRKARRHSGNGKRPYEYMIKDVDIDSYFQFEESDWEQTDD